MKASLPCSALFVLDTYVNDGIGELDRKKLPDLLELKYSSATEAAAELGGPAIMAKAFVGFQSICSKGRPNPTTV